MSKILVKTTFYVSVHKGLGHYFFIYCTVVVFLEKLDKDYFFSIFIRKNYLNKWRDSFDRIYEFH